MYTNMADEDEIDVLGEFSFNSCLAQNNQGIPSCSESEDTVHPQWLLDSTETNWYDIRNRDNTRLNIVSSSRMLTGNKVRKFSSDMNTTWSLQERQLLLKEMTKYGRNIKRISQTIKTKSEAEIQALIEAEHGVNLDTPLLGLDRTNNDEEGIPAVVQEEIITDDDNGDLNNVITMITTGNPTITVADTQFKKINTNIAKNSLLKPQVLIDIKKTNSSVMINPSEIFYEEDLIIGSTELVGAEIDSLSVATKLAKGKKTDTTLKLSKVTKKIGNHRRKNSRSYGRGVRNSSKDNLKSPQNRQRKDSSLSEESTKSPKLQIVFSSGQALPVSEGEQVIKIEKKKDSESDSDIDIDSDNNDEPHRKAKDNLKVISKSVVEEGPIAIPLSRFEPMPRRQKKINLDGEGGYTIMHTETGDLVAIGAEPRKEKPQKKPQINLIQCRLYNSDRPAPYSVFLHVSALLAMDAQAHTSRGEVMGLLGGSFDGDRLVFKAYRPAAAAASRTHCDMDPVSQALAAESLRVAGYSLTGWHHSHPSFPPAPSEQDLKTQGALQAALERPGAPFLGVITSQHWPTGRTASQHRCIRVESTAEGTNEGYQFTVKLVPDVTADSLPHLLRELRTVLVDEHGSDFSVNLACDKCPQAGITYLEKCISSISHHMRSAGYAQDEPVVAQLLQGVRDVFR